NYVQTLLIKSRNSIFEVIRYWLYLAIHVLSIKSTNILVYPSEVENESAKRIFKVKRSIVIPNIASVCFESYEEYIKLRNNRKDFERPYFILLAGAKGNKEAVMLTIKIFNKLPEGKFKLKITGPWEELKYLVKNSSIELTGIVSYDELKKLLAEADYGLSPFFSHIAGTFIKVLSYIASDLSIICSYNSIINLNRSLVKRLVRDGKIYFIKDASDYERVIQEIITSPQPLHIKNPVLCNELFDEFNNTIKMQFSIII
ncbi:MAG: hypothetical protein QW738_09470, partial [Nitrososphaeria archaeon]